MENEKLLVIGSSLFNLKNTCVIDRNESSAASRQLIYNDFSATCKIENLYTPSDQKQSGGNYSYTISLNNSYDLNVINAISDGDGWGATGSNDCQKITFENCKLSRIDFHRPFREHLKLINCDVGEEGVMVTGLGDLIITGGSLQAAENISSIPVFIRSRPDTGGFVDGDLIIHGTRLKSKPDAHLAVHASEPNCAKPDGSPINYQWFKKISVEEVTNKGDDVVELAPYISTDPSRSKVVYPSRVFIENCNGIYKYTRLLSNQLCGKTNINNNKPL